MTKADTAELGGGGLEHPDRWVPRLQRMLERQHGLYSELDGLSRQQSGHIESGDTDALLGVLTSRQALIDQISSVNAELEPFVRSWTRLVAQVTEEQRREVEGRFAALDVVIGGIARRDDEDRARLEARRRAVSESISSANRARAAASAYGGSPAGAVSGSVVPRYQDREA